MPFSLSMLEFRLCSWRVSVFFVRLYLNIDILSVCTLATYPLWLTRVSPVFPVILYGTQLTAAAFTTIWFQDPLAHERAILIRDKTLSL